MDGWIDDGRDSTAMGAALSNQLSVDIDEPVRGC